jgi:hypothetical protein
MIRRTFGFALKLKISLAQENLTPGVLNYSLDGKL